MDTKRSSLITMRRHVRTAAFVLLSLITSGWPAGIEARDSSGSGMRWQPWFEDFSGIWQTNTGIRFGILFSPDSSLITIDTRQMPLRIVEADSVNGSVTFNINTRDPKAIRGWSDPTPEQQAKLKTFEISVSNARQRYWTQRQKRIGSFTRATSKNTPLKSKCLELNLRN